MYENDVTAIRKTLRDVIDAAKALDDQIRRNVIAAWTPRTYEFDGVVAPGYHNIPMGVIHDIPGTAVTGLPETASQSTGVEFAFAVERLEVEPEDAVGFCVVNAFLGDRTLMSRGTAEGIPAEKFPPGGPARFERTAERHASIVVQITNNSSTRKRFRIKLIGREFRDA